MDRFIGIDESVKDTNGFHLRDKWRVQYEERPANVYYANLTAIQITPFWGTACAVKPCIYVLQACEVVTYTRCCLLQPKKEILYGKEDISAKPSSHTRPKFEVQDVHQRSPSSWFVRAVVSSPSCGITLQKASDRNTCISHYSLRLMLRLDCFWKTSRSVFPETTRWSSGPKIR